MPRLFIIAQRVDRLFEFLVGLFRFLVSRLSSRPQRIVNDLKYSSTTVGYGLGRIQSEEFYLLSSSYERKVCSWARMKIWQIEIKDIAWFRYTLPLFFTCLTNVGASKTGDFADIVTGQYCGRQE
jgi:hypothetical protein